MHASAICYLALVLGQERCGAVKQTFAELIEDCPVIAAVKDPEGLEQSLQAEGNIIFVLYGDLMNIQEIVERIKGSGKTAMVHVDLIAGLTSREIAVEFIQRHTSADGIITTKPALVKKASELGLYTVLRHFIIDSLALSNIERQNDSVHPDVIEILPGVMPKIIRKICTLSRVPVIAGGLITDKEDVMGALSAGAAAISSTNPDVWFL